jgi:hypothetical protein
MNKLSEFKNQIEKANAMVANTIADLKAQAMIAFEANLDQSALAQVLAVETSKELTQVEHDEYFHQWLRVDFSTLIDTSDAFQRELLEEYLQDTHCISCDFKNDCVTYSIGPVIVINEEGDVLDQDTDKWIISSDAYSTKYELFAQIEAYMQKTGVFSSVVKTDRYGNGFYVDTSGGAK